MTAGKTLITGADGYLGARLARKVLEETGGQLILWLHATNRQEFLIKQEHLSKEFAGFEERIDFSFGELKASAPFASIACDDITSIIHSAAVTRFNVDEETARQVNIEGTERLLEFAGGCPSLHNLSLLSTIYSSGLKSGSIMEEPFDGKDGFANNYERSKWASENILLSRYNHLPWRIFRVATVIADSEDGRVTQQNAFHNTLKLFYYGLLSVIPGKPDTPVYFVTGDFATQVIFEAMTKSQEKSIFHVAHTKSESLNLGDLIDTAFDAFAQDAGFKNRRVLKPLFCDAGSFTILADGVNTFGQSILSQAVSSVAPFAQQLFISKDIQNQQLASIVDGYRAPDAVSFIRTTCNYLVSSKWRKVSEPSHA